MARVEKIRLVDKFQEFLTRIEANDREKIEKLDRVLVIGAGGVGTWAAIMMGFVLKPGSELIIIDPDELEPVNTNRLPFPPGWFLAGMPKAKAVALYLANLRPLVKVVAHVDYFQNVAERVGKPDVVIEATDAPAAQEWIYSWAREEYKGPLVSAHYDGKNISVQYSPTGRLGSWNIDWEAGYRVVPSYPTVAILVASMAVDVAIARPKEQFTVSFRLP